MVSAAYILSVFAAASAVIAGPFPLVARAANSSCTANTSPKAAAQPNAKAIYLLTNDAAGNSIVALKVAADGTLSDGSITPTGGNGASGTDGKTKAPAAPDALFSQSALKVEGSMLVAVNAGSNTLTMMTIAPDDPTKLTMVGRPVDTLGEFPVSVALSGKNSLACVANTGAKAGLACFDADPKKGLTPLSQSLIEFPLGQSTPPVGPGNTVSQTLFNEDQSMLLTTVKGDPTKNTTGFLSTLPIPDGCPAAKDTRSSPPGTALLFGSAIVPGPKNKTTLFATDASFGAATISLPHPPSSPHLLARTPIPHQKASCWAAISPLTKTAFVTDVAVNHLVEIDPATGDLKQSVLLPNANPGMIDLVAAGRMVYALSPGTVGEGKANVVVVDVGGERIRQVQVFELGGVGSSAQGLAVLV
ncbi:MAG: hypothetical protein HETSPECPRED_002588 [Heterodermia speciosa]|uniref:3-carboxymuconate cyclase n=1 Tax=Heterodermia speciosa TaxID=116794 RepID=A0A8H3F525_9LECA|nr:MAG: hypothetical protein HETSPECPRED_002588 [Heterodermia speciosa]